MAYSTLEDALAGMGIPMPEAALRPQGFTRWGQKKRFWLIPIAKGYTFGDLATNTKGRWFPDGTDASAVRESLKVCRERQAEKHRKVVKELNALWHRLPDAKLHAYLERKRVQAIGLRQQSGKLVIPLRNITGQLWTVQFINADGTKRFFPGGRKHGCFHQLGAVANAGKPVLFAEGYATAATLYSATRLPVIMTVDAGNIEPVVRSFRQRMPTRRFIIAADDDRWGATNTGKVTAEKVAKLFNCSIALPEFSDHTLASIDTSFQPTDWNDLELVEGSATVLKQLLKHIS